MTTHQFLADQDVYFITIRFLREHGFDVITASELHMQQATDVALLQKAKELNRLLITRDKDYGALIFLRDDVKTGVILLRIMPTNIEEVHSRLLKLLKNHSFKELMRNFCVVEPARYRLRCLF